MKRMKKVFVSSVMLMTVLSMSVVVAPSASAAVAGELIKMDGLSSVYYLGADGKRYVFPNEQTYFSWYSDFSSVVTVAQSELEGYPLGKNVTMRPGTNLVKITTDPKVYAVEPNGSLVWVPSEDVAKGLWGDTWASRVVDVPDAFFTNYTVADGQEVADGVYPTGSLVKFGGGADVYYVDADGSVRLVADEAAFEANRFDWDDVVTAPDTVTMPTAGSDITGAEDALTDTSSGAGGVAGGGTGLTVALASDTPAAGNIPAGSPVDFLRLNFTASNDGPVDVNSVKLMAFDLGTGTNVDSVTFYDADGLKVGTSKNVNSDREATFNFATPINVPAGQTVSMLVRATIATGASGNYALGITSATDVLSTGSAAVSGSFPIVGNTKAIVSGTNIGTVTMSSVSQDQTATAEFGEDDVLLASFNLAVANEPVLWESARFKTAGTNDNDIASNFRMLIDGDEVSTASLVDKFVNFDLDNFLIAKNDSVSVEVYGDMGIGNVGNTVELYIDDANDFSFVGQDFGFGVQIASITSLDAAGDGIKVTLSSGDVTLDMDKAATPAKDVSPGDNDVVLATFSVTSNGENATINSIQDGGSDEFIISGTGLACNEIENTELRDVDTNVIFDLTVASSSTANTCTLAMTEEMSLIKGVTRTFEVRTDLLGTNDATPIDNNDTLQVTLEDGAFSITGDTSDASLTNITPNSVTSAVATVKTASLTWTTTSLTAKTVVPGATDIPVYTAKLKAGESSEVTLTSFRLDVQNGITPFGDNQVSELNAYLDGQPLKVGYSNKISNDLLATGYVNFTSLDSANRTIPAGATVELEVFGSFAATFATTGPFSLGVDNDASRIVVKDKDSNAFAETVTNTGTASRVVTLAGTGTLKVELKTDDLKANADVYILAGTETLADKYLAELVMTTANEDIKVKTLVLENVGSSADDDINAVVLYDSSGVEVSRVVPTASGHANFDALNLILPADEATSYFVGIDTKTINAKDDAQGTADHGQTYQFVMARTAVLTGSEINASANEAVTAQGVDSGEDISLTEDANATVAANEYASWADATSTTATISGAVLTSISNGWDNDADGTSLPLGQNKVLGKYTFVFDNGTNRTSANEELKAELVSLDLTWATTSATVTNIQAYIEGDSANKTTAVQTTGGVSSIDFSTLGGGSNDLDLVDGTVVIIIEGDVSSADQSNDNVSHSIADLSGAGDFVYNGNAGTGSDFNDVRLEISEVTGPSLN